MGGLAGQRQQLLLAAAVGFRRRALGHQLLCENVQWGDRRRDGVETAGPDRGEQRRALHKLVSRQRVEAADRHPADMVLGTPDALHERCDAPRRPQLAHQLHRADVDTELQGRGRDDRSKLARTKTRLHAKPAVHRKTAVVGLDAVVAEAISQLVGDALGHPSRVDEHERRPVVLDVRSDALEHRRHLLERRHGAELVVRQLDGHVERPVVTDVDDPATRSTAGHAPVRPGPDQEAGDPRYRPLGRRQPDADRPFTRVDLRGLAAGRLCTAGRLFTARASRRPRRGGDQAVQPLQAQGEVRAALVAGEGVDLVDDHGPHRPQHLAASRRG